MGKYDQVNSTGTANFCNLFQKIKIHRQRRTVSISPTALGRITRMVSWSMKSSAALAVAQSIPISKKMMKDVHSGKIQTIVATPWTGSPTTSRTASSSWRNWSSGTPALWFKQTGPSHPSGDRIAVRDFPPLCVSPRLL